MRMSSKQSLYPVALLAEGVDRNLEIKRFLESCHVALLAEGVDRNKRDYSLLTTMKSPSSRRAWIEISSTRRGQEQCPVALLAEGVDRNIDRRPNGVLNLQSPSSRRAWIEMEKHKAVSHGNPGSPSSRRAWIEIRLA